MMTGGKLPSYAPPDKALNARQELFVKAYVLGKSASEAAREAGYAKGTCRHAAYNLLRRPHIAAAVDKAKQEIQDSTKITAESLMQKLEDAYQLAINSKPRQMTAAARMLELQGKLAGLLIERNINMEVPVSIVDALAAARGRALPGDDAKLIEGMAEAVPQLATARAQPVERVDPAGIFD